jgi:hypothetical protein
MSALRKQGLGMIRERLLLMAIEAAGMPCDQLSLLQNSLSSRIFPC